MEIIKSGQKGSLLVFSILFYGGATALPVEINSQQVVNISSNTYLKASIKNTDEKSIYKLMVFDDAAVISFSKQGSKFSIDMSKEKGRYELKCTSYTVNENKHTCVVTLSDKGLYYLKINDTNHSVNLLNNESETKYSINNTGYCYREEIDLSIDISEIKRKFNRHNWLQTIISTYGRRWASGVKLVEAQANDPYFSQFVNKSSFNKMVESLMVAIHEETHMYDLDPSRTDWEQKLTAYVNHSWQPKVPIYGGFPRKEIIPLLEGNVTKPWDDIYLRNSTQGNYLMQGVLSELNAGLTGLIGVAVVGEYVDGYGASNAIDSAAAYMYHLQLYLRQAQLSHPEYYNQIKSEQLFRDFITIQWLRLHYYINLAKRYSKLGTDYQEILELLYRPNNIKAIEEFTGHSILLAGDKSCLPENDPFELPF